jgi:hypothetical protein
MNILIWKNSYNSLKCNKINKCSSSITDQVNSYVLLKLKIINSKTLIKP